MDEVEENLQGTYGDQHSRLSEMELMKARGTEPQPHTRKIGLAVLRGPQITILSPVDGSEEIENPFAGGEEG